MMSEWISVKEKLPEKNGYYLCWVEASSVGDQKRCEHRKLYWEENVWLFSPKVFHVEHPIYWMPLPEPPDRELEEERKRSYIENRLNRLGR